MSEYSPSVITEGDGSGWQPSKVLENLPCRAGEITLQSLVLLAPVLAMSKCTATVLRPLEKGSFKWLAGSLGGGALLGGAIWQNCPAKAKDENGKRVALRALLQIGFGAALAVASIGVARKVEWNPALLASEGRSTLWLCANGFVVGAYGRALANAVVKKPKKAGRVIQEFQVRVGHTTLGVMAFALPTYLLVRSHGLNVLQNGAQASLLRGSMYGGAALGASIMWNKPGQSDDFKIMVSYLLVPVVAMVAQLSARKLLTMPADFRSDLISLSAVAGFSAGVWGRWTGNALLREVERRVT